VSFIYLAHVKCWNPVTLTETTLFLSSQGYVTGASNLPPGGVAHTCYNSRIKQPALIRESCWKDKTSGGQSEVTYGAVANVNIDGGLDYLMSYGLHGRDITLIRGEVDEATAPVPTWTIIFAGKMARPYVSRNTFNLHLRDWQQDLNKPLCANLYAGNNVGSVGLEGGAELEGKNKPRIFGRPKSAPLVLVNGALRIYQINDGPLLDLLSVKDRGASLTKGANYSSQADMETNAPGPGTYRTWLAGGYCRLGRDPDGLLTCQPVQGANAAARTCAQVINAILTTSGGIASGNISTADLTALDALQSGELGLAFQDDISCKAAIDLVCKSAGAWWTFDRQNIFRIKRFDAPTGTAVLTLTDVEIIDIEPVDLEWCDVPVWRSTIKYGRNWIVQTTDIASGVDLDTRSALAQEFMCRTTSSTAVKTAYPLAGELVFETDFIGNTITAENTRRFNLYKVPRSAFKVVARLLQSQVSQIGLGVEIKVILNRFGLNAGKNMIVIVAEEDHSKGQFIRVELTLFG
jgi:hypothetical protein